MDKRPFKDGHNDDMMMKMMVIKMIWKNPSRWTIMLCRMEIMDDKMMDDMNLSWNGEVMMKYDGEKRWNMEKVDGDMMGENDNPPPQPWNYYCTVYIIISWWCTDIV